MWPNLRASTVSESEIHDLLRNDRRRYVIRHLTQRIGPTTVRELAVDIAEIESGESPPPKAARDSAYNALHQTHLPKLDACNVIAYDQNRKTVSLNEEARAVEAYMDVVTTYGITWSEFYRLFGTLSLLIVLMALLDIPIIGVVDAILWISVFLGVFALAMAYQIWSHRWVYLHALLSGRPRS